MCCVDAETDVGRVVPGGRGERVARRHAAQCTAQTQVGLLERRADRGHEIAQREVGVVDGQYQHPFIMLADERDQWGRGTGRSRPRDGGDVQACISRSHIDDLSVVLVRVLEVGCQDDAVGQGREALAHHRGRAVPDEEDDDRGAEGLPGAAPRWGEEPDWGRDDEEDAEGGAVRVGDDVAQARVAARDPLLQELHREGEHRAGGDDAHGLHPGEGERDAERDEQDEVGDQLGEGGVAGSQIEGPAWRDGAEAGMEGSYADPEGSGRGGGPGPAFRLAHGARYAGPVGGSSVTLGFGKGSPGARQQS